MSAPDNTPAPDKAKSKSQPANAPKQATPGPTGAAPAKSAPKTPPPAKPAVKKPAAPPPPDKAFSARWQVFWGLLAVAILVGGLGYWAATANIAGAIVAPGQIVVEQNRQVVQHPDGGVVSQVLIKEGDSVTQGDVLIRLDPSELETQRKVVEGTLFEIMARRGRLEAERDGREQITFDPMLSELAAERADVRDLMQGQVRLFESRRDTLATQTEQLQKRISQIRNQLDGLDAQETALSKQLEILREELDSQQALLDKGLTQATKVLALRREEASTLGRLGNLAALRAESEGKITEIRIQILQLASQRREQAITELRDLGYKELEQREQLRALDQKLERMDIRAPVSGVVHALKVFGERAVIRPADPLLYLIPQDRPLVISAQIRPINVDEVFVGQEVAVRFSAFDTRTTPELFGRVTSVSPDTFTDDVTGRQFYRVEIRLKEGELEKLPEGATLLPGMPAESYIRTADRTPLQYLMKPLVVYFNRAFRED